MTSNNKYGIFFWSSYVGRISIGLLKVDDGIKINSGNYWKNLDQEEF